MISFTTPGIILRSRDVASHDRAYTVFTRDRGKLTVRAISIRKADSKLSGSMTPHAIVQMYIIAQRRFTLGGAVIQERFPSFALSLSKSWANQHAREVIDLQTRLEYHDTRLFDILHALYRTLDADATSLAQCMQCVIGFDLKMLYESGVLPDIRTREGKTHLRKRITRTMPALSSSEEESLAQMFSSSFQNIVRSPASLAACIRAYAQVRALLFHQDVEELQTDVFLKDCISNRSLQE